MAKGAQNIQNTKGGGFQLTELFVEILGWLRIAASPFLIGLILAALIYFPQPSTTRLVLAVLSIFAGLLIGVLWATKHFKGKGTMWFLSRIMATPELDKPELENTVGPTKQEH